MNRTTESKPKSQSPPDSSFTFWRRKLLSSALIVASGLIVIAAMGIAQRAGWIASGMSPQSAAGGDADQIYTCPMHPQIRQPSPGRCPLCGMELVPATQSNGADLDELSVRIQPAQRRLANIAVAAAKREPVSDTVQTIGAIAIDESRMATIASYIDGRLERLFADYTGVDVAQGDHLAVIYSPELYSAQVEYIESRKSLANTSTTINVVREARQKLATNTRQKLVELGMREDQIAELESSERPQTRLTVYSPIGGTVTEKLAEEGKYVKAGEPIYRIADLSMVWLMLELYPEDAARIRFGQRVQAELPSLAGEQLSGRIAFVDPTVDTQKRTVGVRVELRNERGLLRPGDYANATIDIPVGQQGEVFDAELAGKWISPMHPQIIRDVAGQCPVCGMDLVPTSRYGYANEPVEQPAALYIPRSALLMAGSNSVVYVEQEPGRFEIRPVTIGPVLRDRVIILAGLDDGDEVATHGNFLIDSQMQLAGKPSLIDPTVKRTRSGFKDESAVNSQKPLEFGHVHPVRISHQAGESLESLFDVYFAIQKSLAADQRPSPTDAMQLNQLAQQLASETAMPTDAKPQLAAIAKYSEHLHHLDLEKARHDAFRPISHAVVSLATLVRGASAQQSFHHMFCPMVEGGGGDWLQPTSDLRNPYWGSEMLTCGDVAHIFPPEGTNENH